MSPQEQRRLVALQRLADGVLTQRQAADELNLSVRQIKRLLRSYRQAGRAALISTRRGRRPNNALPDEMRARIIELCRGPYLGFGPTFTAQKLAERDNISVSRETVRALLVAESLWKPGKSRRHPHPLRQRRGRFGELVQADGSPHAWFGEEHARCTLLVAIDDATSAIGAALFVPAETTDAYFALFTAYFQAHGLPLAAYTDRHSIFRIAGEQGGSDERTQLGEAFHELGIELICANTPQAKGRVERANRTLQDRLCKELRLRGITDIEAANAYLPSFIAEHNARYAVEALSAENANRTLEGHNLDVILVHRYERTLGTNLMFQFENTRYALTDDWSRQRLRRGVRIEFRRRLDGTLQLTHRGRALGFKCLGAVERKPPTLGSKELNAHLDRRVPNPKKAHAPASNHPWKRAFRPRPAAPSGDISALR